jgi:sarcosine oxidase, subunit gamma
VIPEPMRRSPLHTTDRSGLLDWPDLRLRELPFLAQTNLRAAADSPAAREVGLALGAPLPVQSNTWTMAEQRSIVWLGPDEWLIIGPEGSSIESNHLLQTAVDHDWGAVVDVSANTATLELAGASARDLLARGCPLDLHPSVFGPGACAQSLLARVPVILLQRDATPTYWLLVRSSLAGYLAAWLVDAAAEFAPATTPQPADLALSGAGSEPSR